jgi:hypothetical protein
MFASSDAFQAPDEMYSFRADRTVPRRLSPCAMPMP